MVLKNSYYSIKIWGHRISNNDSFGSDSIKQNAAITSRIAPAVTGVMKSFANIDFDPTIKPLPAEKSYRTYVFQPPKIVAEQRFGHEFNICHCYCGIVFWPTPPICSYVSN